MASSPSAPKIRLGPTFATANDVDRDVEEALGLDPDPPTEEMEVDLAPTMTQEKGVDEEIDELLSDTEDTNGQAGEIKVQEEPNWTCRWDDCYLDQEKQDILVEHVQNDHIGQGKEAYICLWENCPRKGQKQATRHSLITHCRAHTGERPYTCGEADCGKTFTRSDALTKHLRSLHGITPELPPSKKRKDPTFGIPSSSLNILGGGDSAAGSSPPPPAHSPSASMGGHSKRSEVDNVIAEVLPPSPLPPTSTETSTIIHPPPATNSSSVPPTQKHAHVRSTTEGTGKPKAKPRKSRAKAQKDKDAAAAAASPIASGSSSTLPSRIRHPPARLPPHSAFAQEGIEDMAVDVDLAAELPKLCARTAFWVESDDDEPALDLVRDHRARERVASPPYRAGEEDYDSLDEEMPPIHAERVVAETLHPDDPETVLPVLSRSNWQARYMMGKAKVMLLSEENEMRRRELMAALEEEADLDEKLAKTVKIDTVKMRTQTSGF